MRSYIVLLLLHMAIFFTLFNPSLGDPKLCLRSFEDYGSCYKVDCQNLALHKWPRSLMPHNCDCDEEIDHFVCTCHIVC
ncbi:hypothetical protein RND71_016457 [Anisodus tanguticus]|uniref:Uncharacterized protein n=1 Tax=Anisodus tanguticus TaxID=243964 RepID=A0AAE1S674_9SOLA|nr:hypothetical protein RND71_016457 [Anisodus tanguticus]